MSDWLVIPLLLGTPLLAMAVAAWMTRNDKGLDDLVSKITPENRHPEQ